MATVNYTKASVSRYSETILWPAMVNADVGQWFEYDGFPDRTVQANGTFDGAVTWEGSLDGVNAFPLNTPLGAAISLTAATQGQMAVECVKYIRPKIAAGTTAKNDVYLFQCGEAK